MAPLTTSFRPSLQKYLKSLNGQPLEHSIESLISLFKFGHVSAPEDCAIGTANLLLQLVAKSKYTSADELIQLVQEIGTRLQKAIPKDLVVGNIVRRVLSLIRVEAAQERSDEDLEALSKGPTTPSTQAKPTSSASHIASTSPFMTLSLPLRSNFATELPADLAQVLGLVPTTTKWTPARISALRSEVIDGIEEIKDEIGQVDEQIAAAADAQIHSEDRILVYEPTKTVAKFLLKAAARRSFTLFLCRAAAVPGAYPFEVTRELPDPHATLRAKLTAAGVKVVDLGGNSFDLTMARVDTVIIPAQVVMADGSVVVDVAQTPVATAAYVRGVPVYVLAGVYRISCEWPLDQAPKLGPPPAWCRYADFAGSDISTAVTDLVPPEHVKIYITNVGTHAKEHLSYIIGDHYKPEDINFSLV